MSTCAVLDRDTMLNVSEQPRFLCDSDRVGWQGALFTSVVCAPVGTIDQVHEQFCVVRVLDPMEVKVQRSPRWESAAPGIRVWMPGDEQRGDWRRGGRSQFLFITGDHVAHLLDRSPVPLGALSHGLVHSRTPNLIFDALEADLVQGSPAGPLVGDALITALVAQMAALPEPRRDQLPAAARDRVIAYMDAYLAQPLRLADLAGVAGTGVRQFSRAFFATTGESPHQHLLRRRIERAKTLIAQKLPLVEIAQRCGFADQSQFTRTFARRVGTTPARYRAALHG